MFRRILVASDLSQVSETVIGCLGGLRRLGAEEAVLVYSINIRDVGGLAEEMMDLARPRLEEQRRLLEDAGFSASTEIALGLPQFEIERVAEEKDCSLIVIGSHGRSMVGEVLLGGVATAVVQSARRPVFVIRINIREKGGTKVCELASQDLTAHILHPTDFSDASQHAFRVVEEMVQAGAGRVTLVHVQDLVRLSPYLIDRLDEFNRIDQDRLDEMKARLETKGARDVNIELLAGSPTREVLRIGREGNHSSIVMGSQGKGFIREVFLGSVSNHVVRNAPLPVLLIPGKR